LSDLGVSVLWRLFRWLPGFLLRKKFTDQEMNRLITIDVVSRKEAIRANLSDVPVCDVWLRLTNRSPFHVILDRAKLSFYCVRSEIELPFRRSISLASGAEEEILITADIPEPKANMIARSMMQPDASSIYGEVDVKFRLYFFSHHTFVKQVSLSDVSEYVVNWKNRLNKLEEQEASLEWFRDQRLASTPKESNVVTK